MLYQLLRNPVVLVSAVARRFETWWSFYCGVLLTPPLLFPILLRKGRIRYTQIGVFAGLLLILAASPHRSVTERGLIDALALVQIMLLWIAFDGFWQRFALFTSSLLMLEGLAVKLFFPHYFAPAAGLVLFLQVDGLRRLWNWRSDEQPQSKKITRSERRRIARATIKKAPIVYPLRGFVGLLPVVFVLSLALRVEGRIRGWTEDPHGPDREALLMDDWSLRRADLEHWLEKQPAPQLVFVRYSPRHNVIFEWVYNHADLMHSHVIWARDLGLAHNQLLLKLLPGRTVWFLEPDMREPQLVPYSEADSESRSIPPDSRQTLYTSEHEDF